VAQPVLQKLVSHAADHSFNSITIDGDTSTNDSFVLIASGKAPRDIDRSRVPPSRRCDADGAGAGTGAGHRARWRRRHQVHDDPCEGGKMWPSAARSPTPWPIRRWSRRRSYASDPNLGRILAAVGYAGDLDVDRVDLWLDDVWVVRDGRLQPAYREEDGQRVMKQAEITVRIALGRRRRSDRVDLRPVARLRVDQRRLPFVSS
jgi:glutamate N-acetyltransferase/amino-acid N-acetyltransferase